MSSVWENKNKNNYPKLTKDLETEVCVIGGGLAGAWTAYLLAKEGKRVVMIDAGEIGTGVTSLTTAFITHEIDTNLADLVKMFGKKDAVKIWESHDSAIDIIEETIKEEGIDCDFKRQPVRVFAYDPDDYKDLLNEHKLATEFGFPSKVSKNMNVGFPHEGIWELPKQAKYHPLKFLNGLIEAAERRGVEIYEKTEAVKIDGRSNLTVALKNGKKIKAKKVVIATYRPFHTQKNIRFKKGMYVSYVLQFKLPKGKVPEGMYLDMMNPYNYFRVDSLDDEHDGVILGGADHREEIKMSAARNYSALKEVLLHLFPNTKIEYEGRWKGPILEPSDGLALIGEMLPNQFVATAFSGNGMTYAAIAGRMISDLIMGRDNPWTHLYDPKRKMKLKALAIEGRDYTKVLIGGAGKNIFRKKQM